MRKNQLHPSLFKRRFAAWMVSSFMVLLSANAVPAYPGWQTQKQPNGQDIQVRLVGDEFYHYWETQDGTLAIEQPNGLFVKSSELVPSDEEFRARRAKNYARRTQSTMVHRAKKETGSEPNLAPRGVVILVNFSDSQMESEHMREVFDDMCNAEHCTTNANNGKNYGSAAQYFADQSKGAYRPIFDVFGPVTLEYPVAYYGEEGELNGSLENDLYLADFVIHAVEAADNAGCDFSQYDSDNDGFVDFVYFIFAGKGQAYGGSSETIWPHNWNLTSALYFGCTHGETDYYFHSSSDWNLPLLDNKLINNYACSAELDGSGQLGGIGTLCHEFGHVMGLTDLYDIYYGEISKSGVTPGKWNIMDHGSYNGNMHCPPNYDPWQKYFFGWVIPENLGNEASNNLLYANGTTEQNTYQVNYYGSQKGATTEGLNYYLEYRQQSGWDEYLQAHGLAVWKVNFNAAAWSINAPNGSGTENAPLYTLEMVGDVEWNGVIGKPVTDIIESDGVVHFKYKGGDDSAYPATPEPKWNDWAYYDNGTYYKSYGYSGSSFYWGIMFPAWSLGNDLLTKIAIYEVAKNNTQPITIAIYSGGYVPIPENKIYTETVDASGQTGFHEITLAQPVPFSPLKNLWVVLNEGTDVRPANFCENTGDPNGRWDGNEGTNWADITSYGINGTFMIRAFFESNPNPSPVVVRKELKLVPNMWAVDEAQFAAWIWGDDVESEWVAFSGQGDTLTAQVNQNASHLLFYRFNPALGLSWDSEWNRTADQTIDWQSGVFTITDWGANGISEGTWEPVSSESTGIEDVQQPKPASKFIYNGQLYIRRNGKVYNVLGLE